MDDCGVFYFKLVLHLVDLAKAFPSLLWHLVEVILQKFGIWQTKSWKAISASQRRAAYAFSKKQAEKGGFKNKEGEKEERMIG